MANEVEEHKCPTRSSAIGENMSLFRITFMVMWSLSGSSLLIDLGWSRVARVTRVWLQWLLVHLGPLGVVVDGGVVHVGPSTGSWLRPTCKRRHGGDVHLRCNIICCIFVGKWSVILFVTNILDHALIYSHDTFASEFWRLTKVALVAKLSAFVLFLPTVLT